MNTKSITCLIATFACAGPIATGAEPSLETAPPVVVRTEPVAGSTGVDPRTSEILATFSKSMRGGSWSWSTWGENNFPELIGQPRYLADGRTCLIKVKLQPGKFYATWLNSEKFHGFQDAAGRAAVPYLLTFHTAEAGFANPPTEREVNKLVREYAAAADLSSPEGACAAWQRANANRDAQAISKLSLVPLDPKEQENWFQREEKRDSAGLAAYLKALAESKIVAVQIWREDLANVITFLPFPEGKGRHPFSARAFGRVNGEWKNLGEDRHPDLESAKTNFTTKQERLWQRFQELKSPAPGGGESVTPPTAPPHPNDGKLNDDQRAVLAWTDRQFKGFFDRRTFDGWSVEERQAVEMKSIDALSGPRSTEYFQAINTLAALRSTKALPALRGIAYERVDRNNRDRWMAIRALGLIGDKADVPELIHLVYHGNQNTHWWAQISLVRIAGQNFGKDWNAWGKWWNDLNGQPPYKLEIIRWWNGQPEPDKLAAALEESDQKFLASLNSK